MLQILRIERSRSYELQVLPTLQNAFELLKKDRLIQINDSKLVYNDQLGLGI